VRQFGSKQRINENPDQKKSTCLGLFRPSLFPTLTAQHSFKQNQDRLTP